MWNTKRVVNKPGVIELAILCKMTLGEISLKNMVNFRDLEKHMVFFEGFPL